MCEYFECFVYFCWKHKSLLNKHIVLFIFDKHFYFQISLTINYFSFWPFKSFWWRPHICNRRHLRNDGPRKKVSLKVKNEINIYRVAGIVHEIFTEVVRLVNRSKTLLPPYIVDGNWSLRRVDYYSLFMCHASIKFCPKLNM